MVKLGPVLSLRLDPCPTPLASTAHEGRKVCGTNL
jgi:hypothetical protein